MASVRHSTSTTTSMAASENQPVYILGVRHNSEEELIDDLGTRLLFTYRTEFEGIGSTWQAPTSDAGWGCMHRSGQMLLAEAFMRVKLGRTWRKREDNVGDLGSVLSLFHDTPSAPFSIHRMAYVGASLGKAIGEWFGPNTLCTVFEMLYKEQQLLLPLAIVTCQDAAIYSSDIEHLANDVPIVLLVPLRPGLDRLHAPTIMQLAAILTFPQSLGFVGGRENSAFWFIGCEQIDTPESAKVKYLDPHLVQLHSALQDPHSYQNGKVHTVSLSNVNPSLALGFFCQNKSEFGQLSERLSALNTSTVSYPVVAVGDTRPKYDLGTELEENEDDNGFVLM